jgi:hypothetical protein
MDNSLGLLALQYFKHAFNDSDKGVVEHWVETPT